MTAAGLRGVTRPDDSPRMYVFDTQAPTSETGAGTAWIQPP